MTIDTRLFIFEKPIHFECDDKSFIVEKMIYSSVGLLFEISDNNGNFIEFIKCENICDNLKEIIKNDYPELLI